ncbi:helix-turn-helix domain-containing protein [Baekduia sp.]|jgi:DNA-binding transcriptional ArsR family regulator|uniref:helix-turn-helix domain-containing protein n=1 Tax=Baekduia sp. TaxID=2600305 RepID=UPI002E076BD5|nr:helix-turn-helix domain-containing protein [Baekduia sp.]
MSKTTTVAERRNGAANKPHELDSNIVKALSHPLRMRILTRLNEGVASPNEMSKEFEESLPLVSYHVRILRELDCIELVRTTPRRGAIEHHYRALTRPFLDDDDWAQLPPSARKAVSNTVLSKMLGDVRTAVTAGTFDERADRHLSYAPLMLDEQGWRDLGDRLGEVLAWAIEEQATSAGRLQDGQSGGPEVRARLSMLAYSAPPTGSESAAPKRRRSKR